MLYKHSSGTASVCWGTFCASFSPLIYRAARRGNDVACSAVKQASLTMKLSAAFLAIAAFVNVASGVFLYLFIVYYI